MARFQCVVGLALLLCGSSTAAAEGDRDQLRGTRFVPSEVQHRMRIVLGRGQAKLIVERAFFNPGDRSDQSLLTLVVPENGVATSLRTLGTVEGRPHWFEGELKEAEAAAAAYQELTGLGGYYPKDPALLSWRGQQSLLLQVFPCPPRQTKTVGYTLELPMGYDQGRYELRLPPMGLENRPAAYTVEAARVGDHLFVDGKPVESGRIQTARQEVTLALEPYRPAPVEGELAAADTGLGRTFMHARFALSKQLSHVPNLAHVVLAIDNSRSMLGDRKAAVSLARATLSHFRDAQVQILDFDRKPNPRFAHFVPKPTALAALDVELSGHRVPEPGNGSEVDLALVEAEKLLMAIPSPAAKRILLFTDTLVPFRTTPESISASLGKSGAVVHVIRVEQSSEDRSVERDDQHEWSAATRLTGGVVWHGAIDSVNSISEAESLKLVRPTTLDHAAYSSSVHPDESENLDSLAEGSGVEHQGLVDGAIRWARLSGELWSTPFRQTIRPDPNANRLWSALAFGSSELDNLSEPEMMVLAQRGGAVSPVTSYLAVEPGVRPSTEGLDWGDAFGAGGLGLSGIGEGGGGRGEGIGLGGVDTFDPFAVLTQVLTKKWAECHGAPGAASLIVETHYVEIADVVPTVDAKDPKLYRCIEEAAWSIDLRGYPFRDQRKSWDIQL